MLPMYTNTTRTITISVYDPAMCCSTGLCGPSVDPQLLQVARDLRRFEAEGIKVERFNLAQEPDAFVQNARIAGLLQAFGDKALPATLINGAIFVYGRYPSREEVVAALKQPREQEPDAVSRLEGGCDCGSDGCC